MNARLRSAIQSARSSNMPKDNIQRAIEKSETNTDSNYESIRYEGFGPKKIAVIVETLTNNKNRTASNLRTIFQKNGGILGTQGVASHNFQQIGVIKIERSEASEDKIFELTIDSGANEFLSNEFYHEVQCNKNEIYNVKKKLEKNINNFLSTEIEWVPLNKVELSSVEKDEIINFLGTLDDDDDVQNVYTNAKL